MTNNAYWNDGFRDGREGKPFAWFTDTRMYRDYADGWISGNAAREARLTGQLFRIERKIP